MKSGKKKVRVEDIAKVLNISPSSVSRALNDHPRISKETKEKVKQVALRMGYQTGLPDLMNPQKAEAVAVLVPSLESDIYREVVAGVTDYFHENNFTTFVLDTRGNEEQATSFFRTHRKYGISGIIHLICRHNIPGDYYSILLKDATPVVTVFEPDEITGISSVLPDVYQGIYKIIEYFQSLNVTRIALLLEDEEAPGDHQTAVSFEEVLETLGMKKDDSPVIYADNEEGQIVREAGKLLKQKNSPQAVLVKGILPAIEVMNLTEKYGLKVPDDLLLVALGTDYHASGLAGNMSLLKIPGYEMGYEAAEMLMYQIKNPDAGRKTSIIPVSFILKGSAIRLK